MSRGQLTEPKRAYAVRDLAAIGMKPTDIANETSLPVSTITDIIIGRNGWAERLKDPSWGKYRSARKRQLQAASLELSTRLLDHASLNFKVTSPYQAVGMYGIIRDKERLDAGEATQNVELHTKGEVVASEATLAALMASMGIDASKAMGYVAPPVRDGHSVPHNGDATSNTSDVREATP